MTELPAKSPVEVNSTQAEKPVVKTARYKTRKKRVAQLIGKRYMVSCAINGVPLQMLFDSDTQVAVVGREWVEKELPDIKIQPL